MFQPCSCVSLPIYELTCIAHKQAAGQPAIDPASTVGQIVADNPQRACALEQLGIDYCCGGKISLREACEKRGLSVTEVVARLAAVGSGKNEEPDWKVAKLTDLIDHIVTTYHQGLRVELPRIAQLAEKVARVHGENHPEMLEVNRIFSQFRAQLELHMQKEEMVLFPGIKSVESTGIPQIFGCGGGIEHPITVMTQEHDEAGEALCAMRRLTSDYTPPADACNTFKVLLFSLAQLESEMHQHVHKENNILFPRALALREPELQTR